MWGEFILACVFLFYWWLLDIVWAICFGEWSTALPYLISFCVKRTDISLESFFPLVGSMFCVWLWKYWFLCCETRNRLALLREFGFSWGYVLRVLIYIYIYWLFMWGNGDCRLVNTWFSLLIVFGNIGIYACCETRNWLALLREFGFSWWYVLGVHIYILV